MISLLKWDSDFFGRKIGQISEVPSELTLEEHLQTASRERYQYLTCRVPLTALGLIDVNRLIKAGFYVTDIGIILSIEIGDIRNMALPVREARKTDLPSLEKMVTGLFRDSRFYNDPFYSHEQADEMYRAWLGNSLVDEETAVFLLDAAGFITCRWVTQGFGEIQLIGVAPGVRRKGVGTNLLRKGLLWLKERGVRSVTVRTQINNAGAINFYVGHGFRVWSTDMTMGYILS